MIGWSVPHTLAQLACAEARLGDLDAATTHLQEAAGLPPGRPQPGTAASVLGRRGPGRHRPRPGRAGGAAAGHRRGDPRAHRHCRDRRRTARGRPGRRRRQGRAVDPDRPGRRPGRRARPGHRRRPAGSDCQRREPGETIDRMAKPEDPTAAAAAGDSLAVGRQTPLEPDGLDGPYLFPPIADYGFLSDCEVNALVAPERQRRVAVLPPPRQPERLRRHAGPGRRRIPAGPDRRAVPAGRRYLPGTLVLETTWQAPSGWLSSGTRCAWAPGTTDTAPVGHLPPAPHRLRGRARPAPHGEVRHRHGGAEPRLRAGVRLRRAEALGVLRRGIRGRPPPGAEGDMPSCGWSPTCASASRAAAPMPVPLHEGDNVFVALGWPTTSARPPGEDAATPTHVSGTGGVLARVDEPGRVPRHPLADPPPAQRPDPEGPHLRAHRGPVGGGHHVAARDARRGAN